MTPPLVPGKVYLIGAGPGDPELITMRGLKLLRAADVVLYDRLIAVELLAMAENAEWIDVGKTPGAHRMRQIDINRLIVRHAKLGKRVVRLKGGDPLTFGRGMEEFQACREDGIDCEIVPGVSSVHAVPAAAGIPITHRGVARSYAVITGQSQDGMLPNHDFSALAKVETLVVLMGLSNLAEIAERLITAGRAVDTPVAAIASGSTPAQRVVTGTLANIADDVRSAQLESPVVTVIGPVAAFAHSNVARAATPTGKLAGRRVLVTQAESTSTNLQSLLMARGANVVNVPLIEITYPTPTPETANALRCLTDNAYDVLAFTSVHGVRGFANALASVGVSTDSIRGIRIAALGHGTAAEASRIGLTVDVIPHRALACDLVSAIDEAIPRSRDDARRILFPRGSRALPTLPAGLAARGFEVTQPVVYETVDAEPGTHEIQTLSSAFDAILFCSPSAVQRFSSLGIAPHDAVIGCIGPTTASEAARLGLPADVVPAEPGSRGLVAALVEHLATQETLVCIP